jgi:hypothetical protein
MTMKSRQMGRPRSRAVAAAALAAAVLLGCTTESSRGPVRWTASNPSSATGQDASQAWSRSTSSDKRGPNGEALGAPSLTPVIVSAPATLDGPDPRLGVTNAQAPMAKWPYDGVTLQLTPAPGTVTPAP